MHTIKGSSAMFGFDEISRFTHEVESIMDLLREGAFVADRRLIDLTLQARDLISAMLNSPDEAHKGIAEELVRLFKEHSEARIAAKSAESAAEAELPPQVAEAEAEGTPETTAIEGAEPVHAPDAQRRKRSGSGSFRERRVPQRDATAPVIGRITFARRGFGRALADRIPPLSEIDPEKCYVGWEITLTTAAGEDAIRDVFIFVEGTCELLVERVATERNAPEIEVKRIGEILVSGG
jgi:two-component system chemotaxis sensor kinase CheA